MTATLRATGGVQQRTRALTPPRRRSRDARMMLVQTLVVVGALVALWAGSTLLLSCLPFFQRRSPRDLMERLRSFVNRGDDVDSVRRWLDRHWEMTEQQPGHS